MTLDVALVGCGAFARLYHVPILTTDPRVRLRADLRAGAGRGGASARRADRRPADGEPRRGLRRGGGRRHQHAPRPSRRARAGGAGPRPPRPARQAVRPAERRTPLALSELAAARGLVAAVAFNRRFDPACRRARELVAAGALGPLTLVETVQLGSPTAGLGGRPGARRRRPVRRPGRTHGGSGPLADRSPDPGAFEPGSAPARRDARTVVASSRSWATAPTGRRHASPPGSPCGTRCVSSARRGSWSCAAPSASRSGGRSRTSAPRGEVAETLPADPAIGAATRDFLDAVDGQGRPACSFQDARLSVRLIEAAFESAARDGAWIVC